MKSKKNTTHTVSFKIQWKKIVTTGSMPLAHIQITAHSRSWVESLP